MNKASKQETNGSQTKTNQGFPKKDYTDFFNEAHNRLKETDYLTKRGISLKAQNRFKIGFVKEWKYPEHNIWQASA